MKTPTVYQMEAAECGAASLAMVLAYFGKELPLEQLRIETGVSRDGSNAANLMRCAREHGLECHGYRKEPEALAKLEPPCIIHWNFDHFVVFEGFKGKYAFLNDPAVGRRRITLRELDEGFTGVVLTFKPTDSFQKERRPHSVVRAVRDKLRGEYAALFQLLWIGLLLVFPGLALTALSRIFMDDILMAGLSDWLPRLLAFMGALLLLKSGLSFYRSMLLQRLRSKLTLVSGYGFLRHLLRLPVSFFDQRYSGDLVERMECNTAVNEFITGELAQTALNIIAAIFFLAALLLYSPLMTAVGLLDILACMAAVLLSGRAAGKAMKLRIAGGKLYGALCAGLSITDTIKASGAEQEYTERILGFFAGQANLEQELGQRQQRLGAIPDAAGRAADVLFLMVGGILVINGSFTLGMLLAFCSLFDSFAEPVKELVKASQKIQRLKADLSRADDISQYAQDARYQEKPGAKAMRGKLSGSIELRDVSFGYSSLKPPLVEHFSFRLGSGESVAFVGASGSGKTTVSKLISGLYRPWSGEVLADGIPLSEIPADVINASIATVSQNIVLFAGTIRDNLTMWNPAVLEEDMIEAAKDACIHDFVLRRKDGYDELLPEGADNISGGERQRLEIARALTTRPSILVMDEATSALDPLLEKQILDNIKRRGCTCVIVAHRLSAVRDCSQILVMDQGKIVQRGTHNSLKDEDGFYRSLVQTL